MGDTIGMAAFSDSQCKSGYDGCLSCGCQDIYGCTQQGNKGIEVLPVDTAPGGRRPIGMQR